MPNIDYSIAVEALLSLDSTENRVEANNELERVTLETLFPDGIQNRDAALCCQSALWLRHGFLDPAHSICQDIKTREGSFWHAIVHRMEKDYWNSKYWFNRVGHHPIFESLSNEVAQLGELSTSLLDGNQEWDPAKFVDFCQAVDENENSHLEFCRTVSSTEWTSLFDFCWEAAHGK